MMDNFKKFDALFNIMYILGLVIFFNFISYNLLKLIFGNIHKIIPSKLEYENFKINVIIYQGIHSFFMFTLSWLVFNYIRVKQFSFKFIDVNEKFINNIIIIFFITFLAAIISEKLKIFNYKFEFSKGFPNFEIKLKKIDREINHIINIMTSIKTYKGLSLLIFFIAVIPSVGEELFFRCILQKELYKLTNHYLAIFISSIIFAVLHFQFYYLLPRIFMGFILGYFFYKTKNIIYSIIIHFLNNTFFLIISFCKLRDNFSISIQKLSLFTNVFIIFIFVSLIFIFNKINK